MTELKSCVSTMTWTYDGMQLKMNIKTNIIYYDYSGIFHNKELLKHLKKM